MWPGPKSVMKRQFSASMQTKEANHPNINDAFFVGFIVFLLQASPAQITYLYYNYRINVLNRCDNIIK